MPNYDVAVIGLGAMGSAALYAIARHGLRVIGFDRLQPAHRAAPPLARAG
jgi:sarcosine oxidase